MDTLGVGTLASTRATKSSVFEPPKPKPCRYFGAISYVHELMKVSDMDKIMRSGCSSRWAARSGRTSTDRLVGLVGLRYHTWQNEQAVMRLRSRQDFCVIVDASGRLP